LAEFLILKSERLVAMQFSWTVAGRKVKLELKKEHDPAAINRNVFDIILEKFERLEVRRPQPSQLDQLWLADYVLNFKHLSYAVENWVKTECVYMQKLK
jgi:hypothetical protein